MVKKIDILKDLNDAQREAVTYNDGPQLVIAGAGSGKTRVLTYKIAYLLEQGVGPQSILALTFTNKAAREMNERIAKWVGHDITRYLWSGTFHSIFSRILRREAQWLNFRSDFSIYDTSDSRSLLKTIIKELLLDEKVYKPQIVASKISNAKNRLMLPQQYAADTEQRKRDERDGMRSVAQIYELYYQRCRLANAMDFDDLLLNFFLLLQNNNELREVYRNKFQYILVDEYQDTNYAQYMILKLLTNEDSKICVVGDDAQSIYGFRGASIDNILNFQNQYPKALVTKLECNYRSTKNIVAAADSVIKHNRRQIPKNVYSNQSDGECLRLIPTYSDKDEAYAVATEIKKMVSKNLTDFQNIALLYRTNAQSRVFEEAFRQYRIPHKIYGGLSFFQRKEVKDVVAYFRLLANPYDEESFKRIINYPARGIGQTTLGRIQNAALTHGISLWQTASNLELYCPEVAPAARKKVQTFMQLIEELSERLETTSAFKLADQVVKRAGIDVDLKQDNDPESLSKLQNIEELLNSIQAHEQEQQEEQGVTHVSLTTFLHQISLLTDMDMPDDDTNKVTLMTVHASKGLEYDVVFITGLEDELFPSLNADIEEERRLFYVAITRAKKICIMSYAKSRMKWGTTEYVQPSRFITHEIDSTYFGEKTRHEVSEYASLHGKPNITFSQPTSTSPFQRTSATTYNASRSNARKLTRIPPLNSSQPTSASTQMPKDLKMRVGSVIEHDRFGIGEVAQIDGAGEGMRIIVNFKNAGSKTLLLKFAKITVVQY
ncbi:MAG: UvrD-helicase domain-containing protein [Bacteroidaceae bacterium]|nr:UvrD-helicase domain-containing protein [Bacteroidaceae bacterium]